MAPAYFDSIDDAITYDKSTINDIMYVNDIVLKRKSKRVRKEEMDFLESQKTDWKVPCSAEESKLLGLVEDVELQQDRFLGSPKVTITTRCLKCDIAAASIPFISEKDWRHRAYTTFSDIEAKYASGSVYRINCIVCKTPLEEANPQTPYNKDIHEAIHRVSLAIEFVLSDDEYDYKERIGAYYTAGRMLRRELVRETGFLYLTVPSQFKYQRPQLVVMPAEI